MATEQSDVTVLGRSRQQQSSPAPVEATGPQASDNLEFRGFDFFSKQDFNQYKNASQTYFGAAAAEKNGVPSSWLGDATPPASAHPSLDEPRPIAGGYSTSPKEKRQKSFTILGLRRPWFWTLLAIIAVIILVAIGVGVGVTSTRNAMNHNAKNAGAAGDVTSDTASPPASDGSTPTSSSSPDSMGTQTPTSPQMPNPTPVVETGCPDINGTIHTIPGSTKQFLQICNLDSGAEDGAKDLGNVFTENMSDCIAECASKAGCEGCGWGYIEGDEGPLHRCWLKSNVKKSHYADAAWAFAVLLD